MVKKNWKLILICAVALAVRIISFGDIPGGFNQDGVMAAVDAKYLAEYGTDRLGMFMPVHFTAWGFGQMSVLMSYLMVPFIKLFGLSVVTARLPILVFSLIGLAALYYLSKKAFNEKLALLILAFAAINPWHIMQSRWALDCNMFPHFFLIGVMLLAYKKHIMSMVFFALSMYCYGVSIYCVPVFLIAACIYLVRNKKISVKKCVLCAFVYLLIAWPFILCMAINAFGGETIYLPFCTIPYFENSLRASDILFFSSEPLSQLWSSFTGLVKIIFQVSDDSLSNQLPAFKTMYIISWPFFIIGAVKMFKNIRRNDATTLICIWFLCAVFTCLVTSGAGGLNVNRANIIFYPMIIFCSVGLYSCIKAVPALKVPLIASYAVAFSLFVYSYFTTYAETIKYTFMEDFGQALSYASTIDADKVYITPNSQMKGTWYVSRILAMYYCDDYSDEKYSFSDKENAEVLVLDEPESGAVQFGRFYVVTR